MSRSALQTLFYEVESSGIAVITIDVPGESVNTLQASFADEFEKLLDTFESDASAKAAILISGKPDTFIVGADIDMLEATKTAAEAEALSRIAQHSFSRLEKLKKPIVAAIHGACLGGGLELALSCHGRVVSDDEKTVLGLPEVQLGLLPGGNGLQRLAQIVGLQSALDLGLTGKRIRPSKARRLGLANDVVARSILRKAAEQYAQRLAEGERRDERRKPFGKRVTAAVVERTPMGRAVLFRQARKALREKVGGHYPATERIVDVLEAYASKGMARSAELEAQSFGQLAVSETARQLMGIYRATTALKKESGVDDPGVEARPIKKVGIVGGGLMGSGIAYVTMDNANIAVRLREQSVEAAASAVRHVAERFSERVGKRQLTAMEVVPKMALLSGTVDYSGFDHADMVIEAVFEDLELKRSIRSVESNCRSETIFATNTSSIPITKIAAGGGRPDLVIGMHYFSPVHKMPLLEVVRTQATAPWVVATCVAFGKKQGKTVIVVNDGVGFYTSRILCPLMNEASYMLSEGVRIDDIDNAMKAWGWPIGPIRLLDEVGIDVASHVGPVMVEAFGERMRPPELLGRIVADGRKGRKNGRGFYLYESSSKGDSKRVDSSVYSRMGVEPKTKLAPEEIQMRCSLQLVNEAVRCLGDGVLSSARDGDIGAIFGLGFPAFRGGPFRYIDSLGPREVLRRINSLHQRLGDRWAPAPVLVEMAESGSRFYR